MQFHKFIYKIFVVVVILINFDQALAISVDWAGGYRFEWNEVDNTSLGGAKTRKAYGLNYLYLTPKIIAADGANVISRFDVFTSQDAAYANSQAGQIWGLTLPSTRSANEAPGFSQNQGGSNLRVSQLYLNLNQEYGSLLLGRAPYEFGLGIYYNAGNDLFDHWADTRDVVGYKFIINDWFFMPMISRLAVTDYAQGGVLTEQILQLQYENKDSGSAMGYIQNKRMGNGGTSVIPQVPSVSAFGTDINYTISSFYFERNWDSFNLKLEADFQSGETGLITAGGEAIKISGYGVASELYWPMKSFSYDFNLRFGIASGDDSNSANIYEAFIFDRNYDVAMLMFNHRIGSGDLLSTGLIKNSTMTVGNSIDDEAIGNVMYVSPTSTYRWSSKIDIKNTITYAQLMVNSTNSLAFQKDLGLEWDLDIVYKPSERVRWINSFGYLSGSPAFQNAGGQSGSTYGFASKAAISF